MFLNELNEKESIAFINLVTKLATVDNVLAKEEENLIKEYLTELNLKDTSINENLELEDIVDVLKNSTNRIKSIIYFELIGLALVDGNYGELEIDYLDKIAVLLDIKRHKRVLFANYFFNFKQVYDFSTVESEDKIKLLKEEAELLLS